MDGAVHYMKIYSFDIPFMNCTIAEIIYFEFPKDSMREVNRKIQGQQKKVYIILKNSRTNLKRNICPGIFLFKFCNYSVAVITVDGGWACHCASLWRMFLSGEGRKEKEAICANFPENLDNLSR